MLVFLDWDRLINDEIWGGQFVLASPAPTSRGTRPPRPLVIYAHGSQPFIACLYGILIAPSVMR